LGIATLNRPKALNALTLDMIRAFATGSSPPGGGHLGPCDPAPGEGRAFCAGGDVRMVHCIAPRRPGPGD